MKNIFKFMGIALMACSLTMVSCSKDDEKSDNNGGNGGNGGTTTEASAQVTFGSTTWDAATGTMNTDFVERYGVTINRLYKVDRQLPYVDFAITTTPGSYSAAASIQDAVDQEGNPQGYTYSAGLQSQDIAIVEYGNQTQVQTNDGYVGDWDCLNATLNLTACDLNAKTLSCTLNAEMYDFYSWMNGIVDNVEDADVENLTVTVNNFKF